MAFETNQVLTYNTKDEKGKEPPQQDRVYNTDGIMTAISAQLNGRFNILEKLIYKIRKLTPLECFRLMGFDDKDYYILKEDGISDSQIYKMAGNSIVVKVLELIFINLFNIHKISNIV
jgi:DNA (cytosine-5)-methyltransferase 1